MLKLRIVPLYGLNDWLENKYKKNDTLLLAFNKLPPLSKKHTTISGRPSHKNNSLFSNNFFIKLKHHLNHCLSEVPNFSLVSYSARSKQNLKNANGLLRDNINNVCSSIYCQWYCMALDFIDIQTIDI